MKEIELRIGDNLWLIKEAGNQPQIMVNARVLAFYWEDYPEPFYAAAKMMMKEIDRELGINLSLHV